jgi:hypothetical protein
LHFKAAYIKLAHSRPLFLNTFQLQKKEREREREREYQFEHILHFHGSMIFKFTSWHRKMAEKRMKTIHEISHCYEPSKMRI